MTRSKPDSDKCMRWPSAGLAAAILFLTLSPARADPEYKTDKGVTRAIELTHLADTLGCSSGTLTGRVVTRKFGQNGVEFASFTLEDKTGRRLINIDNYMIADAPLLTQGWIYDGFKRMIRPGKTVSIGVMYCGANGRVAYLDSIREK